MYRSVVPVIVADVAPATLISVGGVTISVVTAAPACPAGHTRDTHALAPGVEDVPAGQAIHAVDPVTAEYVPAGHATHAAEELAPATAEYVPTGHVTQPVAAHAVPVRSTP